MPRTLGKLKKFVTQSVASIGIAARNLAVLQFADLVKRKEAGQLITPIVLGTSKATVRVRGRVSSRDEDMELFGLGGEVEEDQVETEIEISIEGFRLDPETIEIIKNTSLEDAEKLIIKHELQGFYEVDESRWVDPDA
jgi:hypothetical protein